MAEIEIAALIVDAAALALSIGEVTKKAVPEPTDGLKSKTRWLQCTVKNETQFQILLNDSYIDSGRYYTAPGSIPPFNQMVFSCCNGDNSVYWCFRWYCLPYLAR
ncbi:hypothetical protein EIP86_005889 [Pleurotus ostreatoroseus]|nr:hypothetical protein EIP86_005889 [Pleurotus ostreatoroseus]